MNYRSIALTDSTGYANNVPQIVDDGKAHAASEAFSFRTQKI